MKFKFLVYQECKLHLEKKLRCIVYTEVYEEHILSFSNKRCLENFAEY